LQWVGAAKGGGHRSRPWDPPISTGIDYGNLLLETRLNGEVVQKQFTSDLIFDCPSIVSWVSGWVTLMPGDIIYTGTRATPQVIAGGRGGSGTRGNRRIAQPR